MPICSVVQRRKQATTNLKTHKLFKSRRLLPAQEFLTFITNIGPIKNSAAQCPRTYYDTIECRTNVQNRKIRDTPRAVPVHPTTFRELVDTYARLHDTFPFQVYTTFSDLFFFVHKVTDLTRVFVVTMIWICKRVSVNSGLFASVALDG